MCGSVATTRSCVLNLNGEMSGLTESHMKKAVYVFLCSQKKCETVTMTNAELLRSHREKQRWTCHRTPINTHSHTRTHTQKALHNVTNIFIDKTVRRGPCVECPSQLWSRWRIRTGLLTGDYGWISMRDNPFIQKLETHLSVGDI